MKTLLSAFLIFLPLEALMAQNPRATPLPPQAQPRREVLPGQPTPLPRNSTSRSSGTTRRPASAPVSADLGRNITLQFQGSLLGSTDLDLTLTGCGPQFTTDFARPSPKEGSPANVITISAVVRETVGGLRVEYSLGTRMAFETSSQTAPGGRVARNFEFRDMVLTGAVVVKAGEQVVLSKLDDKTLTLTMNEVTKAE